MKPPSEIDVDESLARALAGRHVAVDTLRPFGEGWDNRAYLVNERLVFRFPRRAIAVPLLEAEQRALPQLGHLPVRVPDPEHVGQPSDEFPWPYLGYALVPGTPMPDVLDPPMSTLVEPLADFLRALHASDLDGLPGDEFGRGDVADRAARAEARLAQAQALGLLPERDWASVLRAAPRTYEASASATCHGDLYEQHLLLDDAGQLAGVIDWGDVHRGDPLCDLSVAHRLFGGADLERFRRRYGPIPEPTWQAARVYAFGHALALLIATHDEDPALFRAARRALEQLVAP